MSRVTIMEGYPRIPPKMNECPPLQRDHFKRKLSIHLQTRNLRGIFLSFQVVFGMSTRKRSNKEKRHLIKISAAFFFTFSPWGRNLENSKIGVGIRFLSLGYVCKICEHPEGPWDLCIYTCMYHTNQRNRRQICHTLILCKRTLQKNIKTKSKACV